MLKVEIGAIAEYIFITECIKREIPIYTPVVDILGIDFIIQSKTILRKIQVKCTSVSISSYKKAMRYKFNLTHKGTNEKYTSQFDFLVAYILPEDIFYIIPLDIINSPVISVNPYNEKCKYYYYKNNFDLITN